MLRRIKQMKTTIDNIWIMKKTPLKRWCLKRPKRDMPPPLFYLYLYLYLYLYICGICTLHTHMFLLILPLLPLFPTAPLPGASLVEFRPVQECARLFCHKVDTSTWWFMWNHVKQCVCFVFDCLVYVVFYIRGCINIFYCLLYLQYMKNAYSKPTSKCREMIGCIFKKPLLVLRNIMWGSFSQHCHWCTGL